MKTRVLILINHLADGGAQRVVPLWAQMLTNAGYDVTVLTFYRRPDEYSLDTNITRASLVQTHDEFKDKNNRNKQLLIQYLSEHPQDILLPHLEHANLIGALNNYQPNVKVVTQIILNNPWDKHQDLDLVLRDWAIQKQGSVILQNDEQMEYFNTKAFQHVKKYIVHNPLNPEIANIKKSHYGPIKKIVAVGRLAPQKNHALMIEAIRILRDEFHETYALDIYGVGKLYDELQAKIKAYRLENQVRLCGRSDDIFHVLINYDLFLMASSYEGTPNALLEAMGLGLPSLAIKCRTGITELIEDGKNGYLLDTYDAHALARKIRQINNPEQLAKIGRQARTDMTRYAPEKIQSELVAVIEDLLANPPNPPSKIKMQPCKLKKPQDYQDYFKTSLHSIKMANYSYGKQIFNHARRTLRNVDVPIPTTTRKIYHLCLRYNQFDVLYHYLQK